MLELDPGIYAGKPVELTEATTKGGKDQLVIDLAITQRGTPDGWSPLPQRYDRRLYLSLSDAAWPYTSAKLAAMGWDQDKRTFSDKPLRLKCTHETGTDGKQHEKWDLADIAGAKPQRSQNAASRLAELYKTAKPAAAAEDDIPF